jgi:hypothetical protein
MALAKTMRVRRARETVLSRCSSPLNQLSLCEGHRSTRPCATRAFGRSNVDREKFYRPAAAAIPGLKLIHGTKTERTFGAILRQGVLPSEAEGKLAGSGFVLGRRGG